MAAKIVFFLALVALACGFPASELNLESTSDVAAVNEVPASASEYFEKPNGETPTEIILDVEPNEVEEVEEARRVRRTPPHVGNVCRHVMIHKDGKDYPIWQCL